MKASELKGLTDEELNNKITELRKELVKLNTQVATGANPKSPGQIKNIRKSIARILTVFNTKKVTLLKKKIKKDNKEESKKA